MPASPSSPVEPVVRSTALALAQVPHGAVRLPGRVGLVHADGVVLDLREVEAQAFHRTSMAIAAAARLAVAGDQRVLELELKVGLELVFVRLAEVDLHLLSLAIQRSPEQVRAGGVEILRDDDLTDRR